MMEMSMWNESIFLDGDWGLESTLHQENGPFGDLKHDSHWDGSDLLSFQPQDAGTYSTSSEALMEEDGLSLEWMESSDLGKYFNELSNVDKTLPLDSSLHEFSSLIETKLEPVEDQVAVLLKPSVATDFLIAHTPTEDDPFDALLSPPDSVEQVIEVSKLEAGSHQDSLVLPSCSGDATVSSSPVGELVAQDFIDQLDFSNVSHVDGDSFLYLGGASELINSPLSADDVDSTLSLSEPSSPNSVKDQKSISIIESSPELYKVISTSTLDATARFSPYQKAKAFRKGTKSPPKRRTPAQPVPEHVISEQVNKKDRKKLQNKNAAIRYRQKKREEAMGIKSEEQELEEYNDQLKAQVEDIEREIRYMKNLMEDVYRAKGLIKSV